MSLTSKDPNIRYANGFLNLKYKDKAVTDESMQDKTSGELFYKRKTDNKIISFSRDNKDVADTLERVKSLIDTNIYFKRPTKYNASTYYNDSYFMSLNYDVINCELADETKNTLLTNVMYVDNTTEKTYMSLETNGFFIGLYTSPRNKSSIDYLTGLYDNYIKNYNTNESLNSLKSKYSIENYDMSNVTIEYTCTIWNGDKSVISYSNAGYGRLNEISYIPILTDITSHESATHITLEINRIYSEKLWYAYKNLLTQSEYNLLNSLMDINDFGINYGTISLFTCTSEAPSSGYTLPVNNIISNVNLFMPLNVFDQWVKQIGNIGSNSGILVSIDQPNEDEWSKITIWAEKIRIVYAKSEVEDTGATTSFDELNKFFGASDIIIAPLTLDNTEYGYYVDLLNESSIIV